MGFLFCPLAPPSSTDIDECSENVALCDHGVCINREGGFRCECDSGYSFDSSLSICSNDEMPPITTPFTCPGGYSLNSDGTGCIKTGPGPGGDCPDGQSIQINDDGSRICIRSTSPCPSGYSLSADGQGCVPPIFTDCRVGYIPQNDGCVKLRLGECPPGFMILNDGVSCRDVNNRVVCPVGYRLSRNGRMCTQSRIGDCDPGQAKNEFGQCSSVNRGHCPEGYVLASDSITCFHSVTGVIFCPSGYEVGRNRDSCVPDNSQGCPSGYYPTQAGNCIPYPPGFCPDEFNLQPDGLTCLAISGRVFCPQGFVRNEDATACVQLTPPGPITEEDESGESDISVILYETSASCL